MDWPSARFYRRLADSQERWGTCLSAAAGEEFLPFILPFIDQAEDELRSGLRRSGRRPRDLEDQLVGVLAAGLRRTLLSHVKETLVLELNVARELGDLTGQEPEVRFGHFIARMRDGAEIRRILNQYPVLFRALLRTVRLWVAASVEMVERVEADRLEISRLLNDGCDLGEITSVRQRLGDPHAGNRSVTLLTFSCGARIIYKPRSLAIDSHFQGFITWLNDTSLRHKLLTTKMLARSDWGWQHEFDLARMTSDMLGNLRAEIL